MTVNHDVTGSSPVGGATKSSLLLVGVDDAEGPPVPIPNTEVKLSGAENTWLATARENREMPTQRASHPKGCFAIYSSIAQSVVAAYIKIPDNIHWFEDTKSENFGAPPSHFVQCGVRLSK